MEEFITDVSIYGSKDAVKDSSTTLIEETIEGHDGNLWDKQGWSKSKQRFIGIKRDPRDNHVVTDLWLDTEDKDIPDGYAELFTKDKNEQGLRKHMLAYQRDERKRGIKAVTDILLINPSKGERMPPFYTQLSNHTVNEKIIVFKSAEIKPVAPPRSAVTEDNNTQLRRQNSVGSPIGGIDGIPFQLNPKFDFKTLINDPIVGDIKTLSIEEELNKYNYTFEDEQKVAETL